MSDLSQKYPHLAFDVRREDLLQSQRIRELSAVIQSELKILKQLPLHPKLNHQIYTLTLNKGAHATVAIEGNTLRLEDVEQIAQGESLNKPSLAYAEQEVRNVFDGFNAYIRICFEGQFRLVNDDLLQEMHRYIGKDLGADFQAVPGRFRQNNVTVGNYRPPDAEDLPELLQRFYAWLKDQFHYSSGKQDFQTGLFQAVCAHVYFELLHPFGDGNGRVGRLLEFYLLMRADVPYSCAAMMANHYNNTRDRYYRFLKVLDSVGSREQAVDALATFLAYALEGFLDGLRENYRLVHHAIWDMAWENHVYKTFAEVRDEYTKKDVFRRIRSLALLLPMRESFTIHQIRSMNPALSELYAKVSFRTLERDVKDLLTYNLLIEAEDAEGNKPLCLNVNILDGFLQGSKSTRHMTDLLPKG
jgi:Fic family protein